jgi:SAM-dependent methyltransferase
MDTIDATELSVLAKLKQGARASWAAGDFPAIARRELWGVGPVVVAEAHVAPGDEVLDVACGTGNAALRAAQAGAVVTGVDLTPELFAAGRELAAEAGVEIDWVQGDAEELPFRDGSFDVVLSTFGCMFAPRHRVAAHEIARVLRPGGRLAIASWTPEGITGAFFRTMGRYLPAPPPPAEPPLLWGSESHVAELFEDTGVELGFERRLAAETERFDSAEEAIEFASEKFGPMMMARQMTEAAGTWPALRAELLDLYGRDEPGEYLLATGRKALR